MLHLSDLHDYQLAAFRHQIENPKSMIWADCGLGKTIITLTSCTQLLLDKVLHGVLVVAPIRVARLVWEQEAANWFHTSFLTFSRVLGQRDTRSRQLLRPAHFYLINYENLEWLAHVLMTHFISKGKQLPFNGLVWDEVTKTKNSSTKRVKAFAKIIPHFDFITGLTATPSSNGLKDLHGQYLMVDMGERLGVSKKSFHNKFFEQKGLHKLEPYAEAEHQIKQLIGDITFDLRAEEHNPLPDLVVNDIWCDLPPKVREKYEQLEKEFFFQLETGEGVEVFNQASLTNKCLQFSNGAVIPEPNVPIWKPVHDAKLEALDEIIEGSTDDPIFLAYNYRADAARIMSRYQKLNPVNLTECKSQTSLERAMRDWCAGKIKLMIAHPASCGHGIDGLQKAGHIMVWFGLNWSLDLYMQFIGRLRRQGIGRPVICHRILTKNTLDKAQAIALDAKEKGQANLRSAVSEYRKLKVAS